MSERSLGKQPETPSEGFRDRLNEAIGTLPERYQLPLVLFHLRGCSLEETAVLLGLNPSTTGIRLARARELLRKKLVRGGLAVCSPEALIALLSAEGGAANLGPGPGGAAETPNAGPPVQVEPPRPPAAAVAQALKGFDGPVNGAAWAWKGPISKNMGTIGLGPTNRKNPTILYLMKKFIKVKEG
jgi:hypothetical protein